MDAARANELDQWEARLIAMQESFDQATKAFREEIRQETEKLQTMALEIAQREVIVRRKEAMLLRQQAALNETLHAHVGLLSAGLTPTKEEKHYEGPIDCDRNISSYVEDLSDSETDMQNPKKSGTTTGSASPGGAPASAAKQGTSSSSPQQPKPKQQAQPQKSHFDDDDEEDEETYSDHDFDGSSDSHSHVAELPD
jgi:hypothetical protein